MCICTYKSWCISMIDGSDIIYSNTCNHVIDNYKKQICQFPAEIRGQYGLVNASNMGFTENKNKSESTHNYS